MVKIKFADLNNGMFLSALEKLANAQHLGPRAAYSVAKLYEKIHKSLIAEGRKGFMAVVKKFAVLDESGEVKPVDEMPGSYEIPEANKAAFEAAMEELMGIEHELAVSPVSFHALEKAGLSAKELLSLEPILVDLPLDQAPATA